MRNTREYKDESVKVSARQDSLVEGEAGREQCTNSYKMECESHLSRADAKERMKEN